MLAEAVEFTHAVAQKLAEDNGIDLLHIKGPALDPSLRRMAAVYGSATRQSVDADVLVRPSHVGTLADALRANGWHRHFDFADGSAFGHAATWGRDRIGFLDVHRFFPGIELDPEEAFDRLWRARSTLPIAGIPCTVPDLVAQRLIMILHAARGRGGTRSASDIQIAWTDASSSDREDVEALADALHARVALYAGTGRLDQLSGENTYQLWRELQEPSGGLFALWWARVKAEPDLRSRVRKGAQLAVPNTRRMETWLGRPPTWREAAAAYRARARMAVRAVREAVAAGHRSR